MQNFMNGSLERETGRMKNDNNKGYAERYREHMKKLNTFSGSFFQRRG